MNFVTLRARREAVEKTVMTARAANARRFGVGFNSLLARWTLDKKMPELTLLADKLGVRNYIKRLIPELAIPKVLMCASSRGELLLAGLPEKYVLKPSNNSGRYLIVTGGQAVQNHAREPIEIGAIEETAMSWLRESHSRRYGELWYDDIEPRIFAEEYIPVQYELAIHCLRGTAFLVQYITRGTSHTSTTHTVNWDVLGIRNTPHDMLETRAVRPKHLDEMIRIAEKATAGLPYVRFDLLVTPEHKFYFGEYTFAPLACRTTYEPLAFDVLMRRMLETGVVDFTALDAFVVRRITKLWNQKSPRAMRAVGAHITLDALRAKGVTAKFSTPYGTNSRFPVDTRQS